MKLKLGIIYGVLIWLLTHIVLTTVHAFIGDATYTNLIIALCIIIITGFFSILYIREINENEVLEGLLAGILFVAIDIILDFIFLLIPNNIITIITNHTSHEIVSLTMIIISTFIGYLAQMNIELK
ncbi:hypothetical protein [uncultured Methanobrevibacter sp.]|uniref:hypothetical protein n=1 Tax=uncultured Methanobrevibacter sp. TaxID=253161 RepID=UPI0025D830E6|nr:hypothetical protein [uncultured Methanobrevibacter sp.]